MRGKLILRVSKSIFPTANIEKEMNKPNVLVKMLTKTCKRLLQSFIVLVKPCSVLLQTLSGYNCNLTPVPPKNRGRLSHKERGNVNLVNYLGSFIISLPIRGRLRDGVCCRIASVCWRNLTVFEGRNFYPLPKTQSGFATLPFLAANAIRFLHPLQILTAHLSFPASTTNNQPLPFSTGILSPNLKVLAG